MTGVMVSIVCIVVSRSEVSARKLSTLTEEPSLYPGVSIKQMFLSKMVSPPRLFLRLRSRKSSKSDHHSGYGFVLADISNIWFVVLPLLEDLAFLLGRGLDRWPRSVGWGVGVIGSTWTIASEVCTMALISDVLPMPESNDSQKSGWRRGLRASRTYLSLRQ